MVHPRQWPPEDQRSVSNSLEVQQRHLPRLLEFRASVEAKERIDWEQEDERVLIEGIQKRQGYSMQSRYTLIRVPQLLNPIVRAIVLDFANPHIASISSQRASHVLDTEYQFG